MPLAYTKNILTSRPHATVKTGWTARHPPAGSADLLQEAWPAGAALLETDPQGLNPPCQPSCAASPHTSVMLTGMILLGYIALSMFTPY